MRKTLLLQRVLRDNFAIPMNLLMYFQNDLIDSILIEPDKIVCPGYLSSFIRELREKHKSLFLHHYREPEFLLDGDFLKQREQSPPDELLHFNSLMHQGPSHAVNGVQRHPPLRP